MAGPHHSAVHEDLVVVKDSTVAVPLTGHSVLLRGADEVPGAGVEVPPGEHAGEGGPVEELSPHHPDTVLPHQGTVTGPPPLRAVGDQAGPLLAGLHHLPPPGLRPLAAVLPPPPALALAHLQPDVALAPPLLAAAAAVVRTGEHLAGGALHVIITLTEPGLHVAAAAATAGLLVVVTGAAVH